MLTSIVAISDFLWSWPLVVFIFAGAAVLSARLNFIQFTKIGFILKNTLPRMFEQKVEGKGNLKPFQAAAASMAATIGVGNIAGVGMAIGIGGPGAVFWMWVVAMFSMIAKFTEVVLGVKYRVMEEESGVYRSGPMYYITGGLGPTWKWLAILYAAMFAVTYFVYSFVQSNTLAVALENMFRIAPLYSGILIAIAAAVVILGGIKTLGRVAEGLVPLMAILYVAGAVLVLLCNVNRIPHMILEILRGAFSQSAAIGGFAGATVLMAMRNGFARGIFSNDGGLGLGAVLHATAITTHPVRQAMWGIFEVFIDTLVVCTSSALVIMVSGVLPTGMKGLALTSAAFDKGIPIPYLGTFIVGIAVVLFAYTTIITNAFYCESGVNYLFGHTYGPIVAKWIKYLYIGGIVYGALGGLRTVWALADLFMALLIIINLPVVIYLSKDVRELTVQFFSEH